MDFYQVFDITIESWGAFFCILAAMISFMPTEKEESDLRLREANILCAVILLCDIGAWTFRGDTSTFGYYGIRITNFLVYLFNYFMMMDFAHYTLCFAKKNAIAKFYSWVTQLLGIFGIVMLVANIFNGWVYYFDENNYYVMGPGRNVSMSFGLVVLILNTLVVIANKNEMSRARYTCFLSYMLIPIVCIIIQIHIYGISLSNISYAVVLVITYFVTNAEKANKQVQQERELNNMKNQLMLSQIQPHFLFNSLNAIYYLCAKNPTSAQEAIGQFSEFLRCNLDSLKENRPVPIEQELHQIENYLMLEQLRFEEELEVVYDIKASDFMVPSLSVQPIVENAVKHGICKKDGGGRVTISTDEFDDHYEIQVKDDGVGFDVNEQKEDGRTHVGLENVKGRLGAMVNGSLEITSTKGQGTTVTIKIPK